MEYLEFLLRAECQTFIIRTISILEEFRLYQTLIMVFTRDEVFPLLCPVSVRKFPFRDVENGNVPRCIFTAWRSLASAVQRLNDT